MSALDSVFWALLFAHIVSGTACIVIGCAALLTRKGGRPHRRAGRAFAWSMGGVIGSAIGMVLIHPSAYLAGLTASAGIAAFSGVRVLGRKRPATDPSQRARPLDWLVASAAMTVALVLIGALATGRGGANATVVYSLAAGTLLYAGWDLWRFAMPMALASAPRLWFYEHLIKMTGAYSAAVAAFSGSILVLLPPPWRQMWAVVAGQVLMIGFVVYYRRRFRPRMVPQS